ncbi:MAG: monovalent cation/H+ antiporter complex subunit F [Desulfurococcaceae archaeon]
MTPLVKLSLEIFVAIYLSTAVIFVFRAIRGPTIFDRVLAIDALSYDLTVFMALIALYTNRHVLAVCMIPIALWAYALDVYVSWYMEHKTRRGD